MNKIPSAGTTELSFEPFPLTTSVTVVAWKRNTFNLPNPLKNYQDK